MRKGFTLIELLIVIAVIAILVGIALPRFRGMREEGLCSKAEGELRSLAAAVESYFIHQSQQYPNQSTAVLTSWQSYITAVRPKIIGTALNDPFKMSQEYSYVTSAASSSGYYVVFSVGPDATATITGISTTGVIQGTAGDDIYFSNGSETFSTTTSTTTTTSI